MDDWKDINIDGIARIDKCDGEFQVWELNKTPYAKFKVKVFESKGRSYVGYTNIRIKNTFDGSPENGVGFGNSITEALEDTLKNFMELINEREEFFESDFEWSDPDDF